MAKKLGGKYKAPAPPTSPDKTSGFAPGPARVSSPDPTSWFSPILHSTPNSKQLSLTSTRVDSGDKVEKMLKKQSLTRQ